MSPRHIEPALLQDHLDGLTEGERAIEIETHLATCERCSHEIAQLRHLFFVLERMPLDELPPGLSERILATVLPKPRRRWAAAIGWGYAASLAVTIAGVIGIASNPATRTLVGTVFQWMSRSAVQLSVFALDGMSAMVLTLAQSWRWMATAGDHITPLTRAAAALLTTPMIQTALAGALATCIVVLWWMHTRERPSSRRSDHVALVGF